MAAVQQAMPQQQGAGNAAMQRMLPPGMSKEKVQEIYRVGHPENEEDMMALSESWVANRIVTHRNTKR